MISIQKTRRRSKIWEKILITILVLLGITQLSFSERVNHFGGLKDGEKTYTLEGKIVLPTMERVYPQSKEFTKIFLRSTDHEFETIVKRDGGFTFFEAPPGTYFLEVHCIDWIFSTIKVEVKSNGQLKATKISDNTNVQVPLILKPERIAEYFDEYEGFNLGGIMKNPMFIMLGFTALMAFAVPKMMANLDPEALRELQNPNGQAQPIEPPPKWEVPALLDTQK